MAKKKKNWFNWFVDVGSEKKAPHKWSVLWKRLLKLGIDKKLLSKVEAASMVIREVRTERWLIDKDDHEYATIKDAINATKKLIYQAVISKDSSYNRYTKKSILKEVSCERKECLLSPGHPGKHRRVYYSKSHCSICGEEIIYRQIMGKGRAKRGSKIDPKVCTMGHIDPLTAGGKHNAENVCWQHKQCNDSQGNLTRSDFIKLLGKIIKFNKKRLKVRFK